ncbi:hypothetical protein GRI89_03110 [Altererythrobacter salegens]|uniref:Uncharacterized protein n=1 Tax=Croceibacterium salegens TaxID=1737568 RepID=A0A6I4SW24_9SPHN|nr:hypothetical protein [Croceibacterium salegens]MXO58532.1 hypothetical protein [Croceibacterium salegens]
MSPDDIFSIVVLGLLGTVSIVGISVGGWVYSTRMKIKNGYPLESMWGKPMHPQLTSEANERVKLVTQENAQLRAELAAMKDRLVVVERIVTDSGYQLGHEIDRLRDQGKVQ